MRACQKVQELYSLTQRKDEAPAPENARHPEITIMPLAARQFMFTRPTQRAAILCHMERRSA